MRCWSEDFRRIKPTRRGMSASDDPESVKKRVSRVVLNKMVGQYSRRLIYAELGEAAVPQMFDETAQRGAFPDEGAVACPCDEVNMNIDFEDARRRRSR
jgi:hypothetical protein